MGLFGINANSSNTWLQNFIGLLPVKDMMNYFFVQEGDVWKNAYMSFTFEGVLAAVRENRFNREQHNERDREWTQQDHEERIAYLLHNRSYNTHLAQLEVVEIEENLYDLRLTDGHHRLALHYLVQQKEMMVTLPTRYMYDLANAILEG